MGKSELQREVAYRKILDRIISGELSVEEPLSERGLSDMLGIGRMPIREAIRDLARDGVLEIVPVRGTFVRAITVAQIHELFDVRQALECLAAQRAAENGPTPELAEFRKALEQSRSPVEGVDIDDTYAVGMEFHVELVRASRNALLIEMYMPLRVRYRTLMRLARFYDQDWVMRGIEDHLTILDAVEAGDGAAAREAMSAHLERSYQSKIRILESMRTPNALSGSGGVLPFPKRG
ncbi:GntR family transcriptional regulator [Cognatishimia maritima]|uniref:DNA-binding transcriptional regulator, GntR family n=1 Tax=Cognatishimia maritima TaxID=870908 RepID=A0A1M5LBB8_9RHOB|nr:GntR family transcriptional regulator [Cognatishimia maritima]SHG62308.1 DNA-binding transcriptional regulator, GntR family [Cognatishimia maritima]